MHLIHAFIISSILFFTPSAAHAVQLTVAVSDSIAGAPDLTGTIAKARVRIKSSGHKLVVKSTICNEGNGKSGAFDVGLYLSTDAAWDEDDKPLGDRFTIKSLAPAACVRAPKFKVKQPSYFDGRFALIVIDPDGVVAGELNTTNNVINKAIERPFLSSDTLPPGQFLAIADDSIVEDSTIEVTFSGKNSYVVKTMTSLTTNGQAKVTVPTFVNLTTNAFVSGTVSVRISGSNDHARLKIKKLPKLKGKATPGAITREVLKFMVDNFDSAQANIESLSVQNDEDFSDWLDMIAQLSASMQAIESELATQQLTVDTTTDAIVLTNKNLRLIDRMLAAYILGLDKKLQAQAPQSAVAGVSFIQGKQRAPTTSTVLLDKVANALQRLNNGPIEAVRLYGSFVSATAGVNELYAAIETGTQEVVPITTIAVMFSVTALAATTAISTALNFETNATSGVTDNVLDEVIDGVESLISTGMGDFNWAGATPASIALLASVTRNEMQVATTLSQPNPTPDAPMPPPTTNASAGTAPIPGFSLDFSPSEVVNFEIDGAIVPNVPVINATGTFNDGTGFVSLLLAFNPLQISGPGTYTFLTANDVFFNQAGEVTLRFSTSSITDISNQPVLFHSTGGSMTLTVYEPMGGGRLTGSFTATIEGQQVTTLPESDEDPTIVTVTGTLSGSFDVPIL